MHTVPSTAASETPTPTIHIRGRSVMALVIAPEWPLEAWLQALDEQMLRSSGLFAQRPVVVNLAAAAQDGRGPDAALEALVALAAREVKVIGVEGLDPASMGPTRWARLPMIPPGRETRREVETDIPRTAPSPVARGPSLLIDRPVRSGQSIVFDQGDVTIVGAVASGAEVIAGGSIHVYGALRGRAIAGLTAENGTDGARTSGGPARIFCRKLEAEMVAVEGRYRTAEHWGPDLHGRPVQIRREQETLRFSPLD